MATENPAQIVAKTLANCCTERTPCEPERHEYEATAALLALREAGYVLMPARVKDHLDRAFNEGRNWCPTANDEQAHDIEMMAAVCLGLADQVET